MAVSQFETCDLGCRVASGLENLVTDMAVFEKQRSTSAWMFVLQWEL